MTAPYAQTEDHHPWQKLAAAVVIQACEDFRQVQRMGGIEYVKDLRRRHYRKALPNRRRKPKEMSLEDCESAILFLRSESFHRFCKWCNVNGDAVLSRIGFV